jgi:hypothetical protein
VDEKRALMPEVPTLLLRYRPGAVAAASAGGKGIE